VAVPQLRLLSRRYSRIAVCALAQPFSWGLEVSKEDSCQYAIQYNTLQYNAIQYKYILPARLDHNWVARI
jgi:hypothetical protein